MHGLTAVRKTFDPRDLLSCKIWMRSDMGIRTLGIVPGNVVQWSNQVPDFSADATQNTQAAQPVYVSGLNGLPALQFDGARLMNWTPSLIGTKTVIAVFTMSTIPHTGYAIYNMRSALAGYSEFIADLSGYQNFSYVDDWTAGATMNGSNEALSTTALNMVMHTYNGGTSSSPASYTGSYNGAASTVVASGAYGNTQASGTMGARVDGSFAFRGNLYEIIMYNRILATWETDSLYGYLKTRYSQ